VVNGTCGIYCNVSINVPLLCPPTPSTRRDLALSYLLTASGRFLDKTGTFNASLFNGRFDALKAAQFTGTEDKREKTFLNLMKP